MVTEARRYEVLAVLGKGGFGTVYHARFLGEGGFSKEVALKVLNPDMENVAEVASRLRDEARVLGLLRHRAIVAVDRLTQIDGRWTVVMEYVDGHDLSQILRQGPFPVGPALEIAAEVAGALHAAFTQCGPNGQPLRLLHRDLKPSNVRITPFGEVKVLDFGIARAEFQEREAKTRSLAFGTPEYMSPERLDLSDDGAPGDVYALGVVLFELLTGMQLGRSSANPAKHVRKLDQAREALRGGAVPADVAELVVRMLSFEATSRPSAAEVEKRAFALSRKLSETSLRSWADEIMSVLEAAPVASEAEVQITGSILVERPPVDADDQGTVWEPLRTPAPANAQRRTPPARLVPAATEVSGAQSVPEVPVPVQHRPTPAPRPVKRAANPSHAGRWLLAGVGVLATFGCFAGAIWWSMSPSTPTTTPEIATIEQIPIEATAVVTVPSQPSGNAVNNVQQTGVALRDQEPTSSNTGTTVSPRAPSTTSKSASAQSPKAPTKVTVKLEGDADGASLSANGKTFALPSTVSPGTYTILASFGGGPLLSVGSATISEGESTVVRCAEQFGKCSAVKVGR